VVQGYNAQAAATADQIVLAAEVSATTNDQTQFVPMATTVNRNLTDTGHDGQVGVFLADARLLERRQRQHRCRRRRADRDTQIRMAQGRQAR